MQLQLGQRLVSADDHRIGIVKHLVLDPHTLEVKTAIVERGVFLKLDIEVPIDLLETAPDELVRIRLDADAVERLPRFDRSRYTSPPPGFGAEGYPSAALLFPAPYPGPWVAGAGSPVGMPPMAGWPHSELEERVIAAHRQRDYDNAVIEAGDEVFSADGESVGVVETVAFDVSTGRPVRLVVRRGLLRTHTVELGGDQISGVDDGVVVLAIDADEFARLANSLHRRAA